MSSPVDAAPTGPVLIEIDTPAATAAPKKSRARVLLPLLVGVAVLTGGVVYATGRGKESTDDAFVEGHVSSVAARISGQVKRVLVKDNQVVKIGDPLVELDERDQAVRVAAAKADVAAADATLRAAETQLALTEKTVSSSLLVAKGGVSQASAVSGTTRAAIDQARADVVAAESRRSLAAMDFTRSSRLATDGSVSQAELDNRKAMLDQAEASLLQARARVSSAEANTENSRGTIESARGRLLAAEAGPEQIDAARAQVALAKARGEQTRAALDAAELGLSYAVIRAETAGVISRRSVEPGQLVSPERPLMAIVPLDDTWVVANFKEDQVENMHAGQTATVSIDTFGGKKLTGHVDSLAAGTGSRFSLLPPDNASGNFTKVVQRVPVLVRLDPHGDLVLRPGMSANVSVVTK